MGRGLTTCLLYVHHREQFKVTSDSKETHNKTWDKGTKAEDLWKACAPGLQRLALGKGSKAQRMAHCLLFLAATFPLLLRTQSSKKSVQPNLLFRKPTLTPGSLELGPYS